MKQILAILPTRSKRIASGNLALEHGEFQDLQKGGAEVLRTGNYVVIWKHERGGADSISHLDDADKKRDPIAEYFTFSSE